jgi:hypothetical protein
MRHMADWLWKLVWASDLLVPLLLLQPRGKGDHGQLRDTSPRVKQRPLADGIQSGLLASIAWGTGAPRPCASDFGQRQTIATLALMDSDSSAMLH